MCVFNIRSCPAEWDVGLQAGGMGWVLFGFLDLTGLTGVFDCEKHMDVSKNTGVSPQIIHLFIGFFIIFTIHFGG